MADPERNQRDPQEGRKKGNPRESQNPETDAVADRMQRLIEEFPNKDPKDGVLIIPPLHSIFDDTLRSLPAIGAKMAPHVKRNIEELKKGLFTPFVSIEINGPYYRVVKDLSRRKLAAQTYSLRSADLSQVPKDEILYMFVNCRDHEQIIVRLTHTASSDVVTNSQGVNLSKIEREQTLEILTRMEAGLTARRNQDTRGK